MSSSTSTAAPASTLPEQTVTASLTAEIMHDLDDGRPTLVAATEGNLGDLGEVTPARLLAVVAEQRAKLDKVERLAAEYEAATAPRADEPPETWTFTSSVTGLPMSVTCMPGCTIDHGRDIETPTHPVDVYCWTDASDDVFLPIDTNGDPEDYKVLSTRIEVHPFAGALAHRLPFAVVEVIDDHWIAGLDPDALETVINTLAGRLAEMRRTHAHLVRVRAAYTARETRVEQHVDQIMAAISTQGEAQP